MINNPTVRPAAQPQVWNLVPRPIHPCQAQLLNLSPFPGPPPSLAGATQSPRSAPVSSRQFWPRFISPGGKFLPLSHQKLPSALRPCPAQSPTCREPSLLADMYTSTASQWSGSSFWWEAPQAKSPVSPYLSKSMTDALRPSIPSSTGASRVLLHPVSCTGHSSQMQLFAVL